MYTLPSIILVRDVEGRYYEEPHCTGKKNWLRGERNKVICLNGKIGKKVKICSQVTALLLQRSFLCCVLFPKTTCSGAMALSRVTPLSTRPAVQKTKD